MARRYEPRLERAPSALTLVGIPVITIMLASMAPILPIISTAPVVPPLGLLMILSWRLLVRELWPVWAALPLGLFDDLFSGQPFGSAAFSWTLMFLVIDQLDRKMMWRDYWQDWVIAAGLIVATLSINLWLANMAGGGTSILYILPQMLVSILCLPLLLRIAAALDHFRWQL